MEAPISSATSPESAQKQPRPRGIADTLIASLLGIAVFAVFVRTLCPTIYTDDCGEIATAVATGGVVHPPGYPLYCLAGAVFIHLIPHGEPAWRLGLFSSLSAAFAVALTYMLCRRIGAGQLWAGIGALGLAFSYTLWQQATKVETYALNACFVAALLNLAIIYSQTGRRSAFYWLAGVGGLALTNHLTIAWLAPALLWIAGPTLFASESRPWRILAVAASLCFAMLSLYGYEVFAARAHPGGQVWGDPSTAERFYLQVTGARYHGYFTKLNVGETLSRDFVFVPEWLWRNLGLLLPFSLAGAALLWRGAGKRFAQGLSIGIAGYLVCNTLYGIDNIFEYYTPAVLILAALASVGVEGAVTGLLRLCSDRAARQIRPLAAACAAVILVCLPAVRNWPLCDRSRQTFVRTLALDTLLPLPPNAVLVVSGDNRIFPIWYEQDVMSIRRDVTILPRDLLWDLDTQTGRQTNYWYLKKLASRDHSIHPWMMLCQCASDPGYANTDGPIWQIAREKLIEGRPVYISEVVPGDVRTDSAGRAIFQWIHAPVMPTPEGLCYRLVAPQDVPSLGTSLAENLALETRLHIQFVPPAVFVEEPDGPFSDITYGRFLTQVGKMLILDKRYRDAYSQLEAATTLDSTSAEAADSFATAALETGKTDQAVRSWQRAVALDPTNSAYRANLQKAMREVAEAGGRGG